jgi:hypothetical protein
LENRGRVASREAEARDQTMQENRVRKWQMHRVVEGEEGMNAEEWKKGPTCLSVGSLLGLSLRLFLLGLFSGVCNESLLEKPKQVALLLSESLGLGLQLGQPRGLGRLLLHHLALLLVNLLARCLLPLLPLPLSLLLLRVSRVVWYAEDWSGGASLHTRIQTRTRACPWT